jgi:hypothetical protein
MRAIDNFDREQRATLGGIEGELRTGAGEKG